MKTIYKHKINCTVIIVGKNAEKTLGACIDSVNKAIQNSNYIDLSDIIYVDSKSLDGSVEIAKKKNINIIEIVDGHTSAALGRYLGLKYSKYKNVLFLDSDMELDLEWFNNSFNYYLEYNAIHGERYEKIYKKNSLVKEVPKYFGIERVNIAQNIGGCFMINMKHLPKVNFSPILKEEEEKDFYAKFLDLQFVYQIPIPMFIHNNYNPPKYRLKSYFKPYEKIGYLLSFFYALKNKYLLNYIRLQKHYFYTVFASVLFYYFLFLEMYFYSTLIAIGLSLIMKKLYKGALATMVFFPIKIIMSIIFLNKKFSYSYKYKNNIHQHLGGF